MRCSTLIYYLAVFSFFLNSCFALPINFKNVKESSHSASQLTIKTGTSTHITNATWPSGFSTLISLHNLENNWLLGSWEYSLPQQASRMDFMDTSSMTKTTFIWNWNLRKRYCITKPLLESSTCSICKIPEGENQLNLNTTELYFVNKEYKERIYCSHFANNNQSIEYWESDQYQVPVRINIYPNNPDTNNKIIKNNNEFLETFQNLKKEFESKKRIEKNRYDNHHEDDDDDGISLVFKNFKQGTQKPSLFDVPEHLNCQQQDNCTPLIPFNGN